jgi:hypothetical protein
VNDLMVNCAFGSLSLSRAQDLPRWIKVPGTRRVNRHLSGGVGGIVRAVGCALTRGRHLCASEPTGSLLEK